MSTGHAHCSAVCMSLPGLILSWLAACIFFFFNDTATTEIYTLSLHDALPIWCSTLEDASLRVPLIGVPLIGVPLIGMLLIRVDRKSTRLNSSHVRISYAV